MKHRRYRTWIEIDAKKLRANVSEFLSLIPKHTKLMAVIKSNAYGHGLVGIAKTLAVFPKFKKRGWFGVDSITEAVRLRQERVTLPILVLGYVLPERIKEAAQKNISITVSTFQTLRIAAKQKKKLSIYLKFDTGMHRQGFYAADVPRLIESLKRASSLRLLGVFTHFAAAKDIHKPYFTKRQFAEFSSIVRELRKTYPKIIAHASASAATLLFPNTHEDMVRIGIGLYGYFPSVEVKKFLKKKINLQPILQWRSIVSEIKNVLQGEGIGYDLSERMAKKGTIAIIPVGYWHGFDRRLSSRGYVLIRGKRVKVLGLVSMDMIVVNVTNIHGVKIGDVATIIGRDGAGELWGEELATMLGTTVYEVLTRLNPLIFKKY